MASGGHDFGDREHQEDAWLVRDDAVLCAVCDAVGASTSGHPAASLTIATLVARFERGAAPAEVLAGVEEANREVLARSHAARTRTPPFEPRWLVLPTTPGQIWLLCSDGLTLTLGEEGIAAILRSGGSSGELVERLMTAATAVPREISGAKDNITAVIHLVGELARKR